MTTGFEAAYNAFRATPGQDPTKRPWFCHATGAGEHSHASGTTVVQGPDIPVPAYDGLVRGNLSWEDCLANARSFDAALRFAQRYPTVRAAEAAGWVRGMQYVPGMGTHHRPLAGAATFNRNQPNYLQYSGNSPDSVLIGMSWMVSTAVGSLGQPPAGFAGNNDVWHPHRALCFSGGNVVGNNIDQGTCGRLGGVNVTLNQWMAHAWIVPNMQFQTDVHHGYHPCLLTTGLAPAGHACWAQAQHDHTLPGPHDEHGMDH